MLTAATIAATVALALAEDAPWGDITSELFIPETANATAALVAREAGVLAGMAVVVETMRQCSPDLVVTSQLRDGEVFAAGDTLAVISGPARALLRAERIALNFVQRLSGIATMTAQYVAATAGTKARIVDTRKTTPGLRAFEKYAVCCGGGFNHRFSLSDAVMAKDNHLAVLLASGLTLTEAIASVRARVGHTTHLEVEVDRVDDIEPVLAGGVDTIMLDNFSLADLKRGVDIVAGRALVEASGGVTLAAVADIAACGVDFISVGALTHGVRSLDIGLDMAVGSNG